MGYTTQFEGVLKFDKPLTSDEYDYINTILGQDARDHPEWKVPASLYLNYIDLELVTNGHDVTGLQWDGTEKARDMVAQVNSVTRLMRAKFPDFKLSGRMLAQGEEIGDIWRLVVDDAGIAARVKIEI